MPNFNNIVVLTGAGISQESGLKTFRDANGLWEGHRFEEVATPEAFRSNPELVYRFYNLRRAQLKEVAPNSAHLSLATFEENFVGNFTLITQNVDNLHERAGSKNIIHMHGELTKIRCEESSEIFDWHEDLDSNTVHPLTGKKTILRPHICWFGEVPYNMDKIFSFLAKADLFVAIGTSGVVYPAAGFVSAVSKRCKTVLLNIEESENNPLFGQVNLGSATSIVKEFFDQII